MHIGNNNYHNCYNDFALYCAIHQRLSKNFTNFLPCNIHVRLSKYCVICFFHFTDGKLIHTTIWHLSYESCYSSASPTEKNIMLSIPGTSFQYYFCLGFWKAVDWSMLFYTICWGIIVRATVFSIKKQFIFF